MKHAKLKITLMTVLAITFGLALVGCGPSNAKYDYKVTFDYNIGNLATDEVKDAIANQYLGVKENSLIVKYPNGEDQHFPLQSIDGYEFDGWYFPEMQNGEVVVGENGCVVTGEEVDFKTYRVTKDVTLYASFVKKHTLTVLGRTADGNELALERDIVYSGAVGKAMDEPVEGRVAQAEGYSLVEYYKDEALTEIFPFPYTFGETDEIVYAKFLEGEWAAVTAATNTAGSSSVINGFNNALQKNMNIYLRRDIDYSNAGWVTRDYSGIILGNGHAVRNITFARTSSTSNTEFSFFGDLGDSFEVRDLTFENVNFNVTVMVGKPHQISAFAKSVSSGAKFENFSYAATVNLTRNGLGKNAILSVFEICAEPPASIDTAMFSVSFNGND